MKRILILFLQIIIVLIGIMVFAFLIWFPLAEGRAVNLDLFSIYFDPFILYIYITSIAFFIGMYKAFKLLEYVRQNKIFSQNSIAALKSIKYCAITLSILIVLAGIYIKLFHNKEDDPTGFIAICTLFTFVFALVAIVATKFEKKFSLNTNE